MVLVRGEQVHLGPAPHPKQVMCHQWSELPLCRVWLIARQVVCQLVVDTWSINRLEPERSEDRPLIQSANIIAEGLGDHSSLFVDVQHCGRIVGPNQY